MGGDDGVLVPPALVPVMLLALAAAGVAAASKPLAASVAPPMAAAAMAPAPVVTAVPATGVAAAPARRAPAAADEFFVVSSVDAARGRIVLKRPTEVTLVMHVTGRTAYRDEGGRALRLTDLRAGDTAYINYVRDAAGEATASLVRLGPMTVQELQRRYLLGAIPGAGP
jgi:hypothetical protein